MAEHPETVDFAGELRLIHSPREGGPGIYEAEDGSRWNVREVFDHGVHARRVADRGELYSVAGSVDNSPGIGLKLRSPIHEWLVYRVKVVEARR